MRLEALYRREADEMNRFQHICCIVFLSIYVVVIAGALWLFTYTGYADPKVSLLRSAAAGANSRWSSARTLSKAAAAVPAVRPEVTFSDSVPQIMPDLQPEPMGDSSVKSYAFNMDTQIQRLSEALSGLDSAAVTASKDPKALGNDVWAPDAANACIALRDATDAMEDLYPIPEKMAGAHRESKRLCDLCRVIARDFAEGADNHNVEHLVRAHQRIPEANAMLKKLSDESSRVLQALPQ